MWNDLTKNQKLKTVEQIVIELEERDIYPLMECIGLGECLMCGKLSYCGKGINKYMEAALDRLACAGKITHDECVKYTALLK